MAPATTRTSLPKRRFDAAHYNHRWFNRSASVILAVDLTNNQTVQHLEQSCIDLASSVNHNKSGLPCEYTVDYPALVYAVPLREGLTSNTMPRNTLRDLHGHCELLE